MNIIDHLSGPHEWGYRDIAEGGFIEDRAPFEAAEVMRDLLEALEGAAALVEELIPDEARKSLPEWKALIAKATGQ